MLYNIGIVQFTNYYATQKIFTFHFNLIVQKVKGENYDWVWTPTFESCYPCLIYVYSVMGLD